MPLVPKEKVDKFLKHRSKIDFSNVFNAMVARPVARKEMESNPKGLAAIEKEWSGHRKRGTWDESTVCEWEHICNTATPGVKHHKADVMEVCVEKNSQLTTK
jgi:hypothetical protein